MATSFPKHPLLILPLLALFALVAPAALAHPLHHHFPVTYHNGPILTGHIDLTLLWYGPFGRAQKRVIRSFINSLNCDLGPRVRPQVSHWWRVVESYQSLGRRGPQRFAPIHVKVGKQVVDKFYSVGKILIFDFIKPLVEKVQTGNPNSIVVIFAGRGVAVHGLCMGKCAIHGVVGKQPYIVVGEPETECPGSCAWPFHKSDYERGAVLRPPNGNIGADAMVSAFATGLAETVSNPLNTGFYGGIPTRPIEAGNACPNMFGSRSFPGNAGKILIDRATGGAYNAFGARGRKFLVPAVWNPTTSSCWTLL